MSRLLASRRSPEARIGFPSGISLFRSFVAGFVPNFLVILEEIIDVYGNNLVKVGYKRPR